MITTTVGVRLNKELKESADKLAKELGINTSTLMRMALVDYLKRNNKECGNTQD